jgi:hypothetical protein
MLLELHLVHSEKVAYTKIGLRRLDMVCKKTPEPEKISPTAIQGSGGVRTALPALPEPVAMTVTVTGTLDVTAVIIRPRGLSPPTTTPEVKKKRISITMVKDQYH